MLVHILIQITWPFFPEKTNFVVKMGKQKNAAILWQSFTWQKLPDRLIADTGSIFRVVPLSNFSKSFLFCCHPWRSKEICSKHVSVINIIINKWYLSDILWDIYWYTTVLLDIFSNFNNTKDFPIFQIWFFSNIDCI